MSWESYVEGMRGLRVRVLAWADFGNYQGDWAGLVRGGDFEDRFGFIVIGYGSCSGCDEWEAAATPVERAEILVRVLREAKWFSTLDDAQAHIADAGKSGLQWYGHEEGWTGFVERALAADEYTEASDLVRHLT